eukprot:gene6677-6901_t
MGPHWWLGHLALVLGALSGIKFALKDLIEFRAVSVVVEPPVVPFNSSFAQHFFHCNQRQAWVGEEAETAAAKAFPPTEQGASSAYDPAEDSQQSAQQPTAKAAGGDDGQLVAGASAAPEDAQLVPDTDPAYTPSEIDLAISSPHGHVIPNVNLLVHALHTAMGTALQHANSTAADSRAALQALADAAAGAQPAAVDSLEPSHVPGSAETYQLVPDFSLLQQALSAALGSSLADSSKGAHALGDSEAAVDVSRVDPTTFLTLEMLMDTIDQIGAWQSLVMLMGIVMGLAAVQMVFRCLQGKLLAKNPTMLLPTRVCKDPKKLDAFFTLRQAMQQRDMWFRLVGVSGAAVRVAVAAEEHSLRLQSRAKAAIRFAADQLQLQRRLLQKQHDSHAAALRLTLEQQHSQTMALLEQQYQQEVGQLRQECEQQARVIVLLEGEKDALLLDVRARGDQIVENRALLGSLQQQLVEVKGEKAHLDVELRQTRDQLATERGKLDQLLHEELEVKGHAHQVSTKYEMLQDQLSAARSSNAQLANEVQHLQVNAAAAEKTICELQSQKQLLDEKREQLQEQLATTTAQLNEARSQAMELSAKSSQSDDRAQLLQVQVRQLEDKAVHLQGCLAETSNSNTQLRSELQDVSTARTAAEASLQELRVEKQGLSSKLDELQQRLTGMAADLAGARSQQATTDLLLQQHRDAGQSLQEKLTASQATVAHHVTELGLLSQALSTERATAEQLAGQQQQLESQSEQQCVRIADQEAAIQELTSKWQQEQASAAESLQKVHQLTVDNNLLLEKCNLFDVRLEECIQLLEDRELQLQELLDEKAGIERRLVEATSSLEMKVGTLRAAQASLSDTEGQLHDELERNTDLSRDNCMLQRQLEIMAEDNKQLSEEVEELIASRDQLTEELEHLAASHTQLLVESMALHNKTEDLLADNVNSLVELGGKLTAAQAGLAAVTVERDELAKKLYWAEIARDQHGAAKNLATKDAIEARQALTEQKLLRRQASGSSQAGLEDAAAGSASAPGGLNRQLLRQSSSFKSGSKTWRTVEATYLKQNYNDKPARSSDSPGPASAESSPRTAHSPAAAAAATGRLAASMLLSTHSPRSRLSPYFSRCNEPAHAPDSDGPAGSTRPGAAAGNAVSAACLAMQQLQHQQHQGGSAPLEAAQVSNSQQPGAAGAGPSGVDFDGVVVSSFVAPSPDNGMDALRESASVGGQQLPEQAMAVATDAVGSNPSSDSGYGAPAVGFLFEGLANPAAAVAPHRKGPENLHNQADGELVMVEDAHHDGDAVSAAAARAGLAPVEDDPAPAVKHPVQQPPPLEYSLSPQPQAVGKARVSSRHAGQVTPGNADDSGAGTSPPELVDEASFSDMFLSQQQGTAGELSPTSTPLANVGARAKRAAAAEEYFTPAAPDMHGSCGSAWGVAAMTDSSPAEAPTPFLTPEPVASFRARVDSEAEPATPYPTPESVASFGARVDSEADGSPILEERGSSHELATPASQSHLAVTQASAAAASSRAAANALLQGAAGSMCDLADDGADVLIASLSEEEEPEMGQQQEQQAEQPRHRLTKNQKKKIKRKQKKAAEKDAQQDASTGAAEQLQAEGEGAVLASAASLVAPAAVVEEWSLEDVPTGSSNGQPDSPKKMKGLLPSGSPVKMFPSGPVDMLSSTGSIGNESRLVLTPSPQRFRSKFGMFPSGCSAPAAAGAAVSPAGGGADWLQPAGPMGLYLQDQPGSTAAGYEGGSSSLGLLRRSVASAVDVSMYRSSVQWKTLSASGPQQILGMQLLLNS